jgi:uncharacterized protein YjbJ (UPF0337 family)
MSWRQNAEKHRSGRGGWHAFSGPKEFLVATAAFGVREGQMGKFIDKTKGKIKQAIADLTGDKGLKREGKTDEIKGKIEGAVDDAKGAVTDAVKDAKRAVKDTVK